jgi:hypothetical protein
MAKSPRPWIVTRPTTLTQHEENLWTVEGPVPGGEAMGRRMSIVRLSDGRLVFLDAVPPDDEQLARIRTLGRPAFLLVSHGGHCIDVHAFREKLGVQVLCPQRSMAKVQQRVQVDGPLEQLPEDPALRLVPVGGSKQGEAWAVIQSPGGRVSVHSPDAFMNITRAKNLVLRLLGFSGGPRCVPLFKLVFVEDKQALRESYQAMIDLPGLCRVIPCHGEVVEQGAAEALRRAKGTI